MTSYYITQINRNLKRIKDKTAREYYTRLFQKTLVTGKEKQLIFINNQVNLILDCQKGGINYETSKL